MGKRKGLGSPFTSQRFMRMNREEPPVQKKKEKKVPDTPSGVKPPDPPAPERSAPGSGVDAWREER